jgi:nucleoside-diphosphate-sugar epimerase
MRSFVTGGTGFIGERLVRKLRGRGEEVAVLVLGPLIGRLLHQPPNLRELIHAADGVTYWATDAKARRELGYSPRDLAEGLRQTLGI